MRTLGTLLVAALVSGAACYGLHWWGAVRERAVEVPPLDGLDPSQARSLLAARDLLLVLDGELTDASHAGALVQQHPLAGSRVPRGTTIHALIAKLPSPIA